ncbi:MAG: acetylglutamate kinase [Acidimicrobiia bacterium]|nr:acetylglutamate kinase [Acidimicrobiia bacterium]MDH5292847.1 acetylglutamate kinase [Acidimicrobiia bacterium]
MTTGHSSPHSGKVRIANSMGKASILMEAMPYIQRFRGEVVVIKYGGSTMEDPALQDSFARDVTLLHTVGILPVIVHGGGPQISAAMEREGVTPTWVDGLRVTDHATIRVVQKVLVGEVNTDIVNLLGGHGAGAIGISGLDAGLFTARPRDERLGFVGEITRVNTDLMDRLLEDGLVPVVAPLARGADGAVYNCNADTAAAALASALQARKLVYLTDVEGVYRDKNDPSTLVQRMDLDELRVLLESMEGGMLPKLTSVAEAIEGGVRRAHILDGRVQHAVLLEMFTREGIGTMITRVGDERE